MRKDPGNRRSTSRLATGALVAVLVALPLLAVHAGQLYKWTDKEGNVHFSDRPPPEPPPAGYQGPPQITVGEALKQRQAEEHKRRLEEIHRQELAAQAATEQAAKAAKAAAEPNTVDSPYTCEQARQILAGYQQPGRRFFYKTPQGETKERTPEQMQGVIEQWRQAAAKLCRKGVKIVHGTKGGAPAGGSASASGGAGSAPPAGQQPLGINQALQ